MFLDIGQDLYQPPHSSQVTTRGRVFLSPHLSDQVLNSVSRSVSEELVVFSPEGLEPVSLLVTRVVVLVLAVAVVEPLTGQLCALKGVMEAKGREVA